MAEYIVAKASKISDGERIITQVQGREIAVFNVEGQYYAYTNWCAHQGGPCCEGSLTGTWSASFDRNSLKLDLEWDKDDEIINCPWHGWEYDIKTGECLSREKVRLPRHDVSIKEGDIVISLPG